MKIQLIFRGDFRLLRANAALRRPTGASARRLRKWCSIKKTNQISVREICEATGINCSSFYLHYADIPALITAIVGEKWTESVERIHEEMHGDPNIFSEAYVAATLREAKRDRAFYRAYFEKFGTAELEKGYQTLFENVFKPFFRRLGIESEHCMEYHFEFVKAGYFAVTRKWLLYGCPETPEEMAKIIKRSMAAIPDDLLPVPDELFI